MLLGVIGTTAMAMSPRTAYSERCGSYRIGYLSAGFSSKHGPYADAFGEGLRALGYRAQQVEFEKRYAEGDQRRLPSLATELVRLAPDVIVVTSSQAAKAAKDATTSIPIVMASSGDPVAVGLVASMGHPGGNVTGLSVSAGPEIGGKWVEFLTALVPGARQIGMLINPGTLGHPGFLQAARAAHLQTEMIPAEAGVADAVELALGGLLRRGAVALIVPSDTLFLARRRNIVGFAADKRVPAAYGLREFADSGGLISYGADLKDLFRRAAAYVDKIFRGAKPADLPVEQPTKFELVINLKTAKALGLTVPQSLLARADEVIE